MKTFEQIFYEKASVKETLLFTIQQIKVLFSGRTDGSHSIKEKLKRINKTFQDFRHDMFLAFKKLKTINKAGKYLINFKKHGYKVIMRYTPGEEIFIFTLLANYMSAKDYDYKIVMEEFGIEESELINIDIEE